MKDDTITFRIDSKTKQTLEKIAVADKRSLGSLLDKIIDEYLKQHPELLK